MLGEGSEAGGGQAAQRAPPTPAQRLAGGVQGAGPLTPCVAFAPASLPSASVSAPRKMGPCRCCLWGVVFPRTLGDLVHSVVGDCGPGAFCSGGRTCRR